MTVQLRSSRRVPAALSALALLAAGCGQTAPSPEGAGGPAVAAEPGPATPAEDAGPPPSEATGLPTRPPAREGTPEPDATPEEPAAEPDEAAEAPDGQAAQPEEPAVDASSSADEDPAPQAEDPPAAARAVVDNDFTPFAAVAGVTLHHPAARVERVGFHQANHDGARQLEILGGAIAPMTLEDRDRATGSRSAADVVVDPDGEIRAPVTGTVLRAGTYVLYCDYSDDYVVIEPDARPGWEVKLLHIDGVQVAEDQRVEAGRTLLAPRPTPLPFESQVDEHTAEPSWPHVHLEVVDPSIPNESSGGGC